MPVLENVVLMYTQIQKPAFKYQSTTEKEYKVTAIVSKAQQKEWNKKFKKQPAKVVENEDFEDRFGVAVPFPDQDEQYEIVLKRDTHYADGNPIDPELAPKVLLRLENGKNRDVTKTTLVGNGSVGAVSYTETENDYGTFARLKNVRVDDLVAYESNAGSDELGELEEADDELVETIVSTVVSKPVAPKPAVSKPTPAKAKAVVEEEVEEAEPAPAPAPVAKRGRPAKKVVAAVVEDNSPF